MLNPFPILLVKIISSQVGRGFLRTQDVRENDQNVMSQSRDRFWLATSTNHTMVEGRHVIVCGTGNGPGNLAQDRPYIRIAFGRLAAQPLLPALLVSRRVE